MAYQEPRSTRTTKVLVADDEPQNLMLLTRSMKRLGYDVVAAGDGQAALNLVASEQPDVIILDVDMPHIDGVEVCRRVKQDPVTRLLPVILVTGFGATADRVKGLDAGADDFVTKPFVQAELEARVKSLMRQKRYTDQLDSSEAVMMCLALTIEARDPYTHGHCERLADYASAVGGVLGLSETELIALHRGGILHDIGKIGISDVILLKPAALTATEFATMQRHTLIGDVLCRQLRSLDDVRPIVRHHHERLDGTGYPDGLRGDDVPLLAQIMSVVDAFDAMTTIRPYRPAHSVKDAFRELEGDVARGWKRRDLVDAFVAVMTERAKSGDDTSTVRNGAFPRLPGTVSDLWTDLSRIER